MINHGGWALRKRQELASAPKSYGRSTDAATPANPHEFSRLANHDLVSYKAHLTEACNEGRPRIITHVQTETTPAADGEVTIPAHRALAAKRLLPAQHLVDTGYLDAALLIEATRDFGVDLVGPTRPDLQWQTRRGTGFAAAAFHVDWDAQHVTCSRGAKSSGWTASIEFGWETLKVKFSQADCKPPEPRGLMGGSEHIQETVSLS